MSRRVRAIGFLEPGSKKKRQRGRAGWGLNLFDEIREELAKKEYILRPEVGTEL